MKKVDTQLSDDIVLDRTRMQSLFNDNEKEGPAYIEVGLKDSLNVTKDNVPSKMNIYEF